MRRTPESELADPSRPQLSLFMPFWNELEVLRGTVEACVQVLAGSGLDWELVLVDDGSSDGSSEVADQLAGNGVRVVRQSRHLGYGAAITAGFAACRGSVIAYTDADLPVDIARFVELLPQMETHDLVIGYPLDRDEGLRRAVYTAGYRVLVRLALGLTSRSVNFSFKMARRELVEAWSLDVAGGLIDAQVLLESRRQGARILEVPVQFRHRQGGESKFDNAATVLRTVRDLGEVSWRYRFRP